MPSLNLVCTEEHGYITADEAEAKGVNALKLSGTVSSSMCLSGCVCTALIRSFDRRACICVHSLTCTFCLPACLVTDGQAFRKALRAGEDIPEWFAFKSVVDVLRANQ